MSLEDSAEISWSRQILDGPDTGKFCLELLVSFIAFCLVKVLSNRIKLSWITGWPPQAAVTAAFEGVHTPYANSVNSPVFKPALLRNCNLFHSRFNLFNSQGANKLVWLFCGVCTCRSIEHFPPNRRYLGVSTGQSGKSGSNLLCTIDISVWWERVFIRQLWKMMLIPSYIMIVIGHGDAPHKRPPIFTAYSIAFFFMYCRSAIKHHSIYYIFDDSCTVFIRGWHLLEEALNAVKCHLTKLTTKSGCCGPHSWRSAVVSWSVSHW